MPFAISIDLARFNSSFGITSDADQAHVEHAAPSHDAHAHDGSCTCASSLTAEFARSSFGDNTDGRRLTPCLVSAERLRLSYEPAKSAASSGGKPPPSSSSSPPSPSSQMVGIFVPSFLIEELPIPPIQGEQRCAHWFQSNTISSEDVLPRIHASLSGSGLAIRGIVSTQRRNDDNHHDINSINNSNKNITDLVVIEIPQREGLDLLSLLMNEVHGQAMDRAYNSVIKVLPISTISFSSFGSGNKQPPTANTRSSNLPNDGLEIPLCPVCLHRIDPHRLGWPSRRSHEVCSQFCTSSDVSVGSCLNMRFLTPWQDPSYCKACRVIWEQWRPPLDGMSGGLSSISSDASVHKGCYRCGMDQTLWVCLTCGVIGCGRYSHGHAKQHNDETGHPYSLELVTQRIWDYSAAGGGEFVQRSDLLNCSSMQLRLGKGQHGSSNAMAAPDPPYLRADSVPPRKDEEGFPKMEDLDNINGSFISGGGGEWAEGAPSCGRLGSIRQQYLHYDPSPKKATMVGEEYEALLQSALEDQAQHYEGEITALIAALTAQRVDYEKMTEDEASHVEGLRRDIAELRRDADKLSRELLDAQSEEARLRATSQKLLREQAVSKKLLEKIKEEGKTEQDEAQAQVEELEQQVADLTANIRMRDQIKADRELSEAQIFGTTSVPTKNGRSGKKGKKGRRSGGSGRR